MLMRTGYKQTEVGEIPEDWDVLPLCHLAQIRGGIAKNSNVDVSDPISVHYLRVANVQDGYLDLSEMSKIELSRHDLNRYTVLPGDVLMNEGGDLDQLGRGALWRGEFNPCVHQNHVFVVRCKPTLLPNYLNVWTATSPARRFFLRVGKQTTNLASISKNSLGGLPVAVPPLPEQQAIAEALSDTDALIESLELLVTKKRHIKQGTMQELLTGKKRLSGFSGDWKIARLDELGTWKGGMTPSMQNLSYWHMGTVPWISSGDVKSVLLTTTGFSITAAAIKQGITTLLPANSIVVVTRSGILRKYLPVAMNMIPMAINQDIKALIPNDQVISSYLLHTLIGHGDEILARCMKAGTTVESIEFPWMKAFTIPLPPLPEQTAIATILSDMDTEIAELDAQLAKARAIKQGMMNNLLTGKIRLI